jgi:hypothetical protein
VKRAPWIALLAFSIVSVVGADEFVPGMYQSGGVCGTTVRGTDCPGRIVWDSADFYSEKMSDYDRRFVFPHELFHAVQFGYLPFRSLWCETDGVASRGPGGWVMEGMADMVAQDWAASRKFNFQPAPKSVWRYNGLRYYSDPLFKPVGGESFYATSSFWRHLKDKCGSYAILQSVLADDPGLLRNCPSLRGQDPEKIKPSENFEQPFFILEPDGDLFDPGESGKYTFALATAAAFYRDAGFDPICLLEDPTKYSPNGYTIRSTVIDDNAGTAQQDSDDTGDEGGGSQPAGSGIGEADLKFLELVDKILSEFVARLCGGGDDDARKSPYCETYAQEQAGGLAVAYLAFVNDFSERIVTGKVEFTSLRESAVEQIFRNGCIRVIDGAFSLDIAELASRCVQLYRPYTPRHTYHVIASGPLSALDRLHLGWHGCYAAPRKRIIDQNQVSGEKIWVLRSQGGRPGCRSTRDDYTLVFSNVALRAEDTRKISNIHVRIERVVEGAMAGSL